MLSSVNFINNLKNIHLKSSCACQCCHVSTAVHRWLWQFCWKFAPKVSKWVLPSGDLSVFSHSPGTCITTFAGLVRLVPATTTQNVHTAPPPSTTPGAMRGYYSTEVTVTMVHMLHVTPRFVAHKKRCLLTYCSFDESQLGLRHAVSLWGTAALMSLRGHTEVTLKPSDVTYTGKFLLLCA